MVAGVPRNGPHPLASRDRKVALGSLRSQGVKCEMGVEIMNKLRRSLKGHTLCHGQGTAPQEDAA